MKNLLIFLFLIVAASAQADTATINPTEDTYIYSAAATTNYDTATELKFRGDYSTSWAKPIFQFDLSSYSGATINSGTLELDVITNGSGGGSFTLKVFRMKVNWVSDEATWNIGSAAYDWTNGMVSGTDYDATEIASYSFSAYEGGGRKTFDITSYVQDIADGTYTDYGIAVFRDTTGWVDMDNLTFASVEHATTAKRPEIELDYTPASGGGETRRKQLMLN